MGTGGVEPKKFTDPYAGKGDFKPVLSRLSELGFCTPTCAAAKDNVAELRVFNDGSNMLIDENLPVVLYDALTNTAYIYRKEWEDSTSQVFVPGWASYVWDTLKYRTDIVVAWTDRAHLEKLISEKEFKDTFKEAVDEGTR